MKIINIIGNKNYASESLIYWSQMVSVELRKKGHNVKDIIANKNDVYKNVDIALVTIDNKNIFGLDESVRNSIPCQIKTKIYEPITFFNYINSENIKAPLTIYELNFENEVENIFNELIYTLSSPFIGRFSDIFDSREYYNIYNFSDFSSFLSQSFIRGCAPIFQKDIGQRVGNIRVRCVIIDRKLQYVYQANVLNVKTLKYSQYDNVIKEEAIKEKLEYICNKICSDNEIDFCIIDFINQNGVYYIDCIQKNPFEDLVLFSKKCKKSSFKKYSNYVDKVIRSLR